MTRFDWWEAKRLALAVHGELCYYCGAALDAAAPRGWHLDHVAHYCDRDAMRHWSNLVPACVACNASKRDWSVGEWLAWKYGNGLLARRVGPGGTPSAGDGFGVRQLRERLGLSQFRFSLAFGVSMTTVQRWEDGRMPLPPEVVASMARHADVSVEEKTTDGDG